MSAGDVSKAKFLRETLNVADAAAANFGGDGMDSPEVWARYLSNISNLATCEIMVKTRNKSFLHLDFGMYHRIKKAP